MKTAIIRKYTIFGTYTNVYALEYRGKHLREPVNVNEPDALGNCVEYAINSGFNNFVFIDSTEN